MGDEPTENIIDVFTDIDMETQHKMKVKCGSFGILYYSVSRYYFDSEDGETCGRTEDEIKKVVILLNVKLF